MTYWNEELDSKDMTSLLELPAYGLILQNTADQGPVIDDLTILEAKFVLRNISAELDRMKRVENRITSLMWRLKNEIGTS